MTNRDYIVIEENKKGKAHMTYWVFFGILVFIGIYLPFFAPNLRYQTGAIFIKIFSTAGTIMITLGVMLMIWGLFSLFCGRGGSGVKTMLLGFVLIYLGSYFIAPQVIGAGGSGEQIPKGYH